MEQHSKLFSTGQVAEKFDVSRNHVKDMAVEIFGADSILKVGPSTQKYWLFTSEQVDTLSEILHKPR